MSEKPNLSVIRTAPPLTDIPGQLRQLADSIEAGHEGAIETLTLVLQTEDADDFALFEWGRSRGKSAVIGRLFRAAAQFSR